MNITDMTGSLLSKVNYHTRLFEQLPNIHDAVLMYHSVGEPQYYGNVSVERLRDDLRFLSEQYQVVELPEILESGTKKCVAITFDDGYQNFYEYVVPLLEEFDVPVTIFISTGLIDREGESLTRSEWINDEFPEGSVMTDRQIARLVDIKNVRIGNHTRTHPRLALVEDESTLREEIIGAKESLESRFGISVSSFCYPFGNFDSRCVKIVADSHELAVTTRDDLVDANTDRYRIPRLTAHVPKRRLQWHLTDTRRYGANILRTVSR